MRFKPTRVCLEPELVFLVHQKRGALSVQTYESTSAWQSSERHEREHVTADIKEIKAPRLRGDTPTSPRETTSYRGIERSKQPVKARSPQQKSVETRDSRGGACPALPRRQLPPGTATGLRALFCVLVEG